VANGWNFRCGVDDLAELERLTNQVIERIRPIVGVVDLDTA
jgi:hypothetical protein